MLKSTCANELIDADRDRGIVGIIDTDRASGMFVDFHFSMSASDKNLAETSYLHLAKFILVPGCPGIELA